VDPVGNAFLYGLVVSGEYEYVRLAGSARNPPALGAPEKDPRPGEADR
jgi:hypothetical protein